MQLTRLGCEERIGNELRDEEGGTGWSNVGSCKSENMKYESDSQCNHARWKKWLFNRIFTCLSNIFKTN